MKIGDLERRNGVILRFFSANSCTMSS